MALDEPDGNEQPVQVNGIDVLIADSDKSHVDSMTINYAKQPDSEGFVISGSRGSC